MIEATDFYQQTQRYLEIELNRRLSIKQDEFMNRLYRCLCPEDREYLTRHQSHELDTLLGHHISSRQPAVVIRPYAKTTIASSNLSSRIEQDPKKRCLARTGTGRQCSRGRAKGYQHTFCNGHLDYRPYGQVDDFSGYRILNFTRKRRPAHSDETEHKMDPKVLSRNYVEMSKITVNDQPYLLDQKGLIYRFDASCQIVGRRHEGLIKWYSTKPE